MKIKPMFTSTKLSMSNNNSNVLTVARTTYESYYVN